MDDLRERLLHLFSRDGLVNEVFTETESKDVVGYILALVAEDRRALVAALKATEWGDRRYAFPDSLVPSGCYCPECGNKSTNGHDEDCIVGAALAAGEGEK